MIEGHVAIADLDESGHAEEDENKEDTPADN